MQSLFTFFVEHALVSVLKKIPNEVIINYLENGGHPIIDGIISAPGESMFIKQLVKPFLGYLNMLTPEFTINMLRKYDPEKAGIILNHSNGKKFLENVIDEISLWLVSEDYICSSCQNPFPEIILRYNNNKCPYCGTGYEKNVKNREKSELP